MILRDKNTYKLYHVETNEVFEGNRLEIEIKLNIEKSNISRLLNGKIFSIKNWSLQENYKQRKGPIASEELFKFVHNDGRIETMSKNNFRIKYNMTWRDLCSAINRNRAIQGWKLIT